MEQIKERFHLYKTKESFKIHKKQGIISPDSICFIEETRQIYTQGTYYSPCIQDYNAIKEMVLFLDAQVKNMIGIEGHSVGDGIVNNFADLINFLDGFTDKDNLKDYIDSIKDTATGIRKMSAKEIQELENMEPGDLIYDTTNNTFVFYNGTEWSGFNVIPWMNAQ